MRKSFALTLALVCAVTLLVGCGKKVVKTEGVTGTITLDGAPLADCNVYFLAAERDRELLILSRKRTQAAIISCRQ